MMESSPAPVRQFDSGPLLRRLLRNPIGLASMAVLLAIGFVGIIAALIAPHDPNLASLSQVFDPISPEHLLGTDSSGRDVLSRLLLGTQFSLAGAALSLLVALAIGVPTGLIAGYFGGWFDSVSSWTSGMVMALPGIVVLLAVTAVIGPSMWLSMAIFGVLLSPSFFRLVQISTRSVRNELYIDAARVSGLTNTSIIARHVLSVVRAPLIIQAAMVAGIAIGIQAGLEFLGLGDRTVPTWGSLLNDGFVNLYRAPLLILWPALAVGITCIALTLLANAVRDELDARPVVSRRSKSMSSTSPLSTPSTSTAAMSSIESAPILDDGDPGAPLLRITGLGIGYARSDGDWTRVVDGVSLSIARGEIHGLVGESGSGKSQTAFSILGLLPRGGQVLSGSILFGELELADADAKVFQAIRGRRIAYVPQEPMSNLDPGVTVGRQLTEPMRATRSMGRQAAKSHALELLRRVGIVDPSRTFDAYPHEISGGMAQRVLIAGAVSCDPELIIADEPTTALDVTVQADILDLLRSLQQDLGTSMLLVTHNFGVVADLCDRVSVMRAGSIIESGATRDIFEHAQHPYTRSLLAASLEGGPARASYELPTGVAR
jgi:peptide/nickel transport system permease protein